MKYTTALLTLAATTLAAPSPHSSTPAPCKFGTYRCTTPNTGIEICNVFNQWELVGPCPSGSSCHDLPQNGFTLPFCTAGMYKRNGRPGQGPGDKCDTAGKYQCLGPYAIQVCDTQNVLQKVGDCPSGSHCDYLNGIPYCVANV